MARYFLWMTAIVFVGFGFWGLLDPVSMVAKFGIDLSDPNGKTLIRASYGGFLIGAGVLFGWCAAAPSRLQFGLVAVIALTLPILASRLIGLVLDGGTSPYHYAYVLIELLGVSAAAIFLRSAFKS
jgi:hypothetical protein